jgi:hypothetical protein
MQQTNFAREQEKRPLWSRIPQGFPTHSQAKSAAYLVGFARQTAALRVDPYAASQTDAK